MKLNTVYTVSTIAKPAVLLWHLLMASQWRSLGNWEICCIHLIFKLTSIAEYFYSYCYSMHIQTDTLEKLTNIYSDCVLWCNVFAKYLCWKNHGVQHLRLICMLILIYMCIYIPMYIDVKFTGVFVCKLMPSLASQWYTLRVFAA